MMRYRFLRFPGGKFKAVTFSYDDGLYSDIRLAKILASYGMKGTFNLSTGLMSDTDGNHYLSANEVREHIVPLGHEIAIHGHSHSAPGLNRPIDIIDEFLTCRKNLEREFGGIIRGMAYPDSGIKILSGEKRGEDVKYLIKSLDIAYARTTYDDRTFSLPNDLYEWSATAHHNDPEIMKYVDEFLSLNEKKLYVSRRFPKLMFIWGHSAEFDNENNWELLEEICEKLSGREDTWYATNMEICEYMKAYEQLIFSADGKTVYNPTLKTVWFDLDGTLYSVNSGETIYI